MYSLWVLTLYTHVLSFLPQIYDKCLLTCSPYHIYKVIICQCYAFSLLHWPQVVKKAIHCNNAQNCLILLAADVCHSLFTDHACSQLCKYSSRVKYFFRRKLRNRLPKTSDKDKILLYRLQAILCLNVLLIFPAIRPANGI